MNEPTPNLPRDRAALVSDRAAGSQEFGDRAAFVGRIRARQGPPVTVGPHPAPPPPDVVPEVRDRSLDGIDPEDVDALLPVFVAAAQRVSAEVHLRTGPDSVATVVADLITRYGIRRAVLSAEPEALVLRGPLEAMGVEVADYEPASGAAADLGITSAIAAVAATGSVVVDAGVAGSRGASLLPTVHLCVVPRSRLVATPSDALRRGPRPLPSNRVVITGPSRTGDIEQTIVLGAHGPYRVHVLLLDMTTPR